MVRGILCRIQRFAYIRDQYVLIVCISQDITHEVKKDRFFFATRKLFGLTSPSKDLCTVEHYLMSVNLDVHGSASFPRFPISSLLLFVWNTLTVSLTVSTTIPLRQDPLGVDVAGLQGMQ